MRNGSVLAAVAISTSIFVLAATRYTLPDRPPLAHTGGFGEKTCQECHNDNPLNDPGGMLRLSGIPGSYEAGHAYTLNILLARKDLGRAGFEIAARVAEGPQAGHQAGKFEASDERVNVADSVVGSFGPVQYARHTAAGSSANSDTTHWTVKWTAPAAGTGAVVFHLVGNAGNDDNSPMGDYIYSTSAKTLPR
jgi:hypothetical protein